MKRLFSFVALLTAAFALSGCDMIQQEIERAASIELEDYAIDMPNQTIYLKITSDADDQVIESLVLNGDDLDLIDQGDDWYALEDIPIATSYVITRVYYRSSIGVKVPFTLDFSFDVGDALDELPVDLLTEIDGSVEIGDYVFSESEDSLVDIESEVDYTVEELADWVWLILEDGVPRYAVIEIDGTLYVTEAPDDPDDLMN